jgi:hypothetical protein
MSRWKIGLIQLIALSLLASSAVAHNIDCQNCTERHQTPEPPRLLKIQLPTTYEIFRSIVPESEVQADATAEQLLAGGHVQKRMEPVRVYFAARGPVQQQRLQTLVGSQVQPLLASVSEATGLQFVLVEQLREANAVILFSETPRLSTVGIESMQEWIGASAEEFELVSDALLSDTKCFRMTFAPSGRISRSVGFVSTQLEDAAQEKCLAKNLLYSVGLRGPLDKLPANLRSEDHRHIGVLEGAGLQLLYKEGVEPGMSLREAVAVPEN